MDSEILDRVQAFIKDRKLFPPRTPLLVGASGGIDSMVAVDILNRLEYPLGIAHCNFHLRAEDSSKDQKLVKQLANDLNLPFFTIDLDTNKYALECKISIQEAARIQRYEWLEEIRKTNAYHFIITAHHQNDNAETLIYNLVKNTGLRGLHGIPPKRNHIARPLLSLSKEEIHQYATKWKIEYREDATNTSVKYSRNFIRQKILPEMQQINPKAIEAIDALSKKAAEAEILMDERLTQIRRKILIPDGDAYVLKFRYVLQHASGRTILYEVLKEFGFNEDQCTEIYNNLRNQPGGEFLSQTHQVIKDRNSLYISSLTSDRDTILRLDKFPKQILFNNYKIQVREVPVDKVSIKKSSDYAFFDLDKIVLPLTIRYWKSGDYFYPFGLTRNRSEKPGKKKLSKYFKDEKMSAQEKKDTPVIFSGEHLIWLAGHRIDHRFRVTEKTKHVLKMKVVTN